MMGIIIYNNITESRTKLMSSNILSYPLYLLITAYTGIKSHILPFFKAYTVLYLIGLAQEFFSNWGINKSSYQLFRNKLLCVCEKLSLFSHPYIFKIYRFVYPFLR